MSTLPKIPVRILESGSLRSARQHGNCLDEHIEAARTAEALRRQRRSKIYHSWPSQSVPASVRCQELSVANVCFALPHLLS